MLVLSRRPTDKIVFPTLGISVQILRVDGKTIRVGVHAPRTVPVLRAELFDRGGHDQSRSDGNSGEPTGPAALNHRLRGKINSATIAMYVAQKQLQRGATAEAEEAIRTAIGIFENLETELTPARREGSAAPAHALLVEDNSNESSLLASYLRLSGFDVVAVSDGRLALDFLAKNAHPDVVLLDMHLPTYSGPAVLSDIRHDPCLRGLPVFGVSGSQPADFEIPQGPDGVNGWFTKPLNPPQVVEALKGAVSSN